VDREVGAAPGFFVLRCFRIVNEFKAEFKVFSRYRWGELFFGCCGFGF